MEGERVKFSLLDLLPITESSSFSSIGKMFESSQEHCIHHNPFNHGSHGNHGSHSDAKYMTERGDDS